MAALCHDGGGGGGRVVIDVSAGLGFSRQILCWPVYRHTISTEEEAFWRLANITLRHKVTLFFKQGHVYLFGVSGYDDNRLIALR